MQFMTIFEHISLVIGSVFWIQYIRWPIQSSAMLELSLPKPSTEHQLHVAPHTLVVSVVCVLSKSLTGRY